MLVSVPWLDADELPGADPRELEVLVREWGVRRGVAEPLSCKKETRAGLARAEASFRIGDDFMMVWLLSDGSTLLKVTWVSPWDARNERRDECEAIVDSLQPR